MIARAGNVPQGARLHMGNRYAPGMRTSARLVEFSTEVAADVSRSEHLRVFPDPVLDELRVVFADRTHAVFSADVLAFDGRVLARVNTLLSGETIPTRELASGVYTLRLSDTDGGLHIARFVKR